MLYSHFVFEKMFSYPPLNDSAVSLGPTQPASPVPAPITAAVARGVLASTSELAVWYNTPVFGA